VLDDGGEGVGVLSGLPGEVLVRHLPQRLLGKVFLLAEAEHDIVEVVLAGRHRSALWRQPLIGSAVSVVRRTGKKVIVHLETKEAGLVGSLFSSALATLISLLEQKSCVPDQKIAQLP